MIRTLLAPLGWVVANLRAAVANALVRVFAGRRPYRWLRLDLDGQLAEEHARGGLRRWIHAPRTPLLETVTLLDEAARDPDLTGVVLRIGSLHGGWGSIEALTEALATLRARGKTVIAFLESADNLEYLLACEADRIVLAPAGGLQLIGLRAEVTLFGETLERLGVEADFEKVGRYKSAIETFTRTRLSRDARAALDDLVAQLFGQLRDGVAARRGLAPDEVEALVDDGPYGADEAHAAGLVDELAYWDQLLEALEAADERGRPRAPVVSPRRYHVLRRRPYRPLGGHERTLVAWVPVVGTIQGGSGDGGAGSRSVARQLRRARQSPAVRGVVLRVDSPGGSALAGDLIWREVQRTDEAKPVVVSMGDYAASAGYYISAPATAIVAGRGTLTGSIGVFGGKFSLAGVYERLGVHKEGVQRGRHADLLSDTRTFSASERRKVKEEMRAFYDRFLERVADGRGTTVDDVEPIAGGRVWTGAQALERGLVDDTGGILRALSVIRERIDAPPERPLRLVSFAPAPAWGRWIDGLGAAGAGAELAALAHRLADRALPALAPGRLGGWLSLARGLRHPGVLAMLGLDIRIR